MAESRTPRWKTVTRSGILLGLALLAAGFVVRDIRAQAFVETDYLARGLWVAGGLLVFVGVMVDIRSIVRLLKRPRTAERLNFAAVVVLVLVLSGLLCYISTRRFARLDWTGTGEHRLHSKTENILRALDRDVEVTVVYRSMEALDAALFGYVHDMLEEFKSRSSRITVQTLDLSTTGSNRRLEDLLTELDVQNLFVPCVVFATEEGHQVIPFEEIAESSRGPGQRPDIFKGESAFVGALAKLTERERTTLYALTGHGEWPLEGETPEPAPRGMAREAGRDARSLSQLVKALRNDYYEVKPLNLMAEGEVPEDCAALLVAGPRAPLAESEMGAIRSYLDERDGAAIFLVDSRMSPRVETNVGELLKDYGVTVHDGAVGVRPQLFLTAKGLQSVAEAAVPVNPESLPDHPATADLRGYQILLERPCPLDVAPSQAPAALQVRALMTGIPSSWGESDFKAVEEGTAEYDPEEDISKPPVLGALVQPAGPSRPAGAGSGGPKIVVIGSSNSFLNYMLRYVPGNRYLLLNAVNWMAGKVHMVGVPAKSMEFNEVRVSGGWLRASRYLFIGGIPGCMIAAGIVVWLVRRR